MSDGVISLIFAIGFGGWVYSKLMKTTNSQQNSTIGGAVSGLIGFIVLFTLIKFVLHI